MSRFIFHKIKFESCYIPLNISNVKAMCNQHFPFRIVRAPVK